MKKVSLTEKGESKPVGDEGYIEDHAAEDKEGGVEKLNARVVDNGGYHQVDREQQHHPGNDDRHLHTSHFPSDFIP